MVVNIVVNLYTDLSMTGVFMLTLFVRYVLANTKTEIRAMLPVRFQNRGKKCFVLLFLMKLIY